MSDIQDFMVPSTTGSRPGPETAEQLQTITLPRPRLLVSMNSFTPECLISPQNVVDNEKCSSRWISP